MTEIEDLKVSRKSAIDSIRRLDEWLKSDGEKDIHDVEARAECLEEIYKTFLTVQAQVVAIDATEVSALATVENIYYQCRAGMKRLRFKLFGSMQTPCYSGNQFQLQPPAGSNTSSTANSSNLLQQSVVAPVETSIPKIKPFDGSDYLDYPIFKNSFDELIGKRTGLSKIDKFGHLRNSLKGAALDSVQSLMLTEANYDLAWKSLDERYLKLRIIFDSLVKKLFNVQRVGKADSLRKFMDSINTFLKALEGLPATKEEIGFGILIHHVLQKVDHATLVKWEEQAYQVTDSLPKWDELATFLETRANTLEGIAFVQQDRPWNKIPPQSNTPTNNAGTKKTYVAIKGACKFCNNNCSDLLNCTEFTKLDTTDKITWIRANNHCTKCLNEKPHQSKCKGIPCTRCKNSNHHTLLHIEKQNQVSNRNDKGEPKHTLNVSTKGYVDKMQILGTALVKIQNKQGNWVVARALIDGGSMTHFITKRLIAKLQLKPKAQVAPVVGLFGEHEIRESTEVKLCSYNGHYEEVIHTLILPEFNHLHPSSLLNKDKIEIPANIINDLADPTFNIPQHVDVLLGVGMAYKILMVGQIQVSDSMLVQKTRLGWIVAGEYDSNSVSSNKFSFTASCNSTEEEALDVQLHQFWQLDRVPASKQILSPNEEFCENHYTKHTSRGEDGKFVIQLPFLTDPSKLGDSSAQAKSRLLSMERKLGKDKKLCELYRDFMKEYEELGHMELETEPITVEHNYLPHHAVLRMESTSTKCRVVFDGSAVTTSGLSLNDLMPPGPTIQPSLCITLLRFRFHAIILSGDICKMYRQIWVHPDDRKYQCIMWRDDTNQPIKTYKLKTVTYGTSSAPFLAIRTLVELAKVNSEQFPIGAQILLKDVYVDDMMSGGKNVPEVIGKYNQVNDLLSTGGMEMKKWYSNSPEVLKYIPQSQHEKIMRIGDDAVTKSLGLILNLDTDSFMFPFEEPDSNVKWTKRTVVSQVSKIFDPLGCFCPVVTKLKIFMQHLWKLKLNWDESLPQAELTAWLKYLEELPILVNFSVPRYVFFDCDDLIDIQLHGFADASVKAYGCVFYLRCVHGNGSVTIRHLIAKSKVAPLKTITLARLELLGALLMSEVYEMIWPHLQDRVSEVYCWLDSEVALTWVLNSPHRYDYFIAVRVTLIQQRTRNCIWRHVKGVDNPADIVSRGASPKAFLQASEFINGPQFLYEPKQQWQSRVPKMVCDNDPRLESSKLVFCWYARVKVDLVEAYKFHGTVYKVQRAFGYMARFITAVTKGERPNERELSMNDMEIGLRFAVKIIQTQHFYSEYHALQAGRPISKKSSLFRLSPFLDNEGIIRVGGRLSNAPDLTFDEQHPMLLPKKHGFTSAIFYYYHWKTLHTGPLALLAAIRRKFWPIGGRVLATKEYRNCVPCRIHARNAYQQVMADLPEDRVRPFTTCFEVTGVDLFGPLQVKHHGRGTLRTTIHVAVFVCLKTRAVQLHYVMGCDTDSVINAFIRFISRAGTPKIIWSDNAKNFEGSEGMLNEIDWNQVDTWCRREHRIQYKTIPSLSPHHGGMWEASVKSAKKHLYRVMKDRVLYMDAFITLLSMIEAILNSRPITPLSINPDDGQPLTPAHFMIGKPIVPLPDPAPEQLTAHQRSLVETWIHLTEIKNHWVQRWLTEVRQTWQNRYKWNTKSEEIKVGRVVIMVEKFKSPYAWQSAVITKVFPGRDKRVRVVEVTVTLIDKDGKRYQKSYIRGVTELVPIPEDDDKNKDTGK